MIKKRMAGAAAALIILGASVCASAAYLSYSVRGNEAALISAKVSLEEITVPQMFIKKEITAVGTDAFRGNEAVKTVNLPETISSIEWGAFEDCKNLTCVNIPSGVSWIEDMTFSGCESLETVDLPEKLTEIGVRAFAMSGLKSVTLPEGVQAIGSGAFEDCKALAEIVIPESVVYIGKNAFKGCEGLTAVCGEGGAARAYLEANGIPYTIKSGV